MPTTGNYLHWITVTHTVPQVGFFASMILGSIVLFLNFCGAQNKFGPYKYIVNSFTILGMIFAIVEVIVYPNVHNYNAGFLFYTLAEPFGVIDLNLRRMFLASYTFFYAATVALLATQFIYRYWAIFDACKLQYFKGFYWLFWPAFCSFFGLQYALGTFYLFEMDTVSMEYYREEILYRYDWNISEVPAMALVAYDPSNGMITAPTIILFTPLFVIILLPLFNPHVSLPSGAFLCSFTLYPAMDSIIVMHIVSQYRVTARKLYQDIHKAMESFRQARATVHCAVPTTTAQVVLQHNPLDEQSNVGRLSDTQTGIHNFSDDL
ncbi:unnamed protein product [Caenorhabditis nigoni]